MILVLAAATVSQAKTLTVSCHDKDGRSVELTSEITNASQPQQIKSFAINGSDVARYQDVSNTPIYNQGEINLRINIGYNSVTLKLKSCEDSFLAVGSGVFDRYVGGFAGTSPSNLQCTCALK
jgi:hypothetical protein